MQHDQEAGVLLVGSLVKKDVSGNGGDCWLSAAVSIKHLSGARHWTLIHPLGGGCYNLHGRDGAWKLPEYLTQGHTTRKCEGLKSRTLQAQWHYAASLVPGEMVKDLPASVGNFAVCLLGGGFSASLC